MKIKTLHARTRKQDNKTQTLKEHTLQTTNIAASKIYNPTIKKCVELAGILHDMGKVQDRFQSKLKGKNYRVRHAFLGAKYLDKDILDANTPNLFRAIQFMVEGHHSGLKDIDKYVNNINDAIEEVGKDNIYPFVMKFLENIKLKEDMDRLDQIITSYNNMSSHQDIDIITRLGISALKDGDTSDANRFESDKYRDLQLFDTAYFLNCINEYYETVKKKSDENTKVNKLRNQAKEEIESMINKDSGFFILNLPTGLGKTLLSIYWALHHARFNQLRRIIYVLPFNTISDQVGDILISIFGENNVLIDHSGVTKDGEDEPYFVERWDAPIIITSNVQFFETLFANRSNRIAKYHNIQRSVIICDEFQTFPKHLMEPTNIMLTKVQKYLECSFLFSTATMPWIESTYNLQGLDNPISLIKDSNFYYKNLQLVTWGKYPDPLSCKDLAKKMLEEEKSVLCIVNTKTNAHTIYKYLQKLNDNIDFHIFHLSGNQIYSDRKKILVKVKKLLKEGKIVKLISTQLVEAGVDIDFPVVFRTEAPFESLIQSAGRCNREGLLDKGKMVIVILIEKDFVDVVYERQKIYTRLWISGETTDEIDLDIFTTVEGYKRYSRNIINSTEQLNEITEHRELYMFQTVGNNYHLIADNSIRVFIYTGKKRKGIFDRIYEKVKKELKLTKQEMRILKQHSVSIYRTAVDRYVREGYVERLVIDRPPSPDGLNEDDEYVLYRWIGGYSPSEGIKI